MPNLAPARSAERDYFYDHLKKVVAKYTTTEEKQQRLDTLFRKLCIETSVEDVLEKGQKFCLQRALETIRNEL